ncbi:MAG: hypothetical protein AAF420_06335 [Pseudomonadota bacterium]
MALGELASLKQPLARPIGWVVTRFGQKGGSGVLIKHWKVFMHPSMLMSEKGVNDLKARDVSEVFLGAQGELHFCF